MTTAMPVLLLTQNMELRQRWLQLGGSQWRVEAGTQLQQLQMWRQQGHELVLLDADLPWVLPWQDARWRELLEGLKVLVLSATPSDEEGRQALGAGVCGYGHAATSPPDVERMLHSIVQGNIWLGRSLLQRLLQDIGQRLPVAKDDWAQGLTQREKEVAYFAATGESNTEIAERLGITVRTVRAHLSAVFEKLQVVDRLMLALKVHGVKVEPKSTTL